MQFVRFCTLTPFSEIYQHGIDQKLSHEQAQQLARAPAAASGALTATLTRLFPGGKEAFTQPASRQVLRQTVGGVVKDYLGTIGAATGKLAKGAMGEIPEEVIDSGATHFITEMAKGRTFQQAAGSFVDTQPQLLGSAGLMGAAGEGLKLAKDKWQSRGSTPAPGQPQPPMQAPVLPPPPAPSQPQHEADAHQQAAAPPAPA